MFPEDLSGLYARDVPLNFVTSDKYGNDYISYKTKSGKFIWVIYKKVEYEFIECKNKGMFCIKKKAHVYTEMPDLIYPEPKVEVEPDIIIPEIIKKRGRPCKAKRNTRPASNYNKFIQAEMSFLKSHYPNKKNKEYMKLGAQHWELFKLNMCIDDFEQALEKWSNIRTDII